MKKRLILVLVSSLLLVNSVFCQVSKNAEGSILFHGLVVDANTESPLSYSQIFINRSYISNSDGEGKFAFNVNRNDTVVFRRLGYKQAVMYISDTLKGREFIAGIFLHSDTFLIGEVIILPRLASLKSDLMSPRNELSPEYENAKYNLAVSAYQARVTQNKLGDPETNYEVLRQKQSYDAYTKGQIPPDKLIGLSPLLLIPAAYLLMNGLPEKPGAFQPHLTDQDINQIHKKYLETIKQKK